MVSLRRFLIRFSSDPLSSDPPRCAHSGRSFRGNLRRSLGLSVAAVSISALAPLSGCVGIDDVDELSYLNEPEVTTHYLDKSVEIAYPHVHSEQSPDVSLSFEPRTVLDIHKAEVQDMSLEECVHLGLMSNRVLRSKGAYLSGGNSILSNPDRTATFSTRRFRHREFCLERLASKALSRHSTHSFKLIQHGAAMSRFRTHRLPEETLVVLCHAKQPHSNLN